MKIGKQRLKFDYTGQKIGYWTVIKRAQKSENLREQATYWLCRCDCGNIKAVSATVLKRGLTREQPIGCKSCAHRGRIIHGYCSRLTYGKRLSEIRTGMIKRCYNPKFKQFYNYGGRGITVCNEWLNSSKSFYDWAVTNGYDKSLSLDRIDNNKGYSPENCRWVTRNVQSRNTRRNIMLTYNGETMCVADWAVKLGVSRGMLEGRMARGWSIERMLSTPRKLSRWDIKKQE